MPISQKIAEKIASIVIDEIGSEKGQKLLDRLVDQAIIDRIPYDQKQSIINIRNQFNLIRVGQIYEGGD